MPINKSGAFFYELVAWRPHPKVEHIIRRTPFKVFLALEDGFNINRNLLSAIVNKFDPDECCFKFGCSHLVITLEDILYITGLPIDGRPVTGMESLDYRDLIIETLGREPESDRKNVFRLQWLKENFKDVPNNVGEEDNELWYYVRAYLLHILGTFMFPDASSPIIAMMYLKLLTNEEEVNSYAWGASTLAFLQTSIRNYRKNRKGTVNGCTPLLILLFVIRMPEITAELMKNPSMLMQQEERRQQGILGCQGFDFGFPLMVGLCPLLKRPSRNSYNVKDEQHFITLLETSEIVFEPYAVLRPNFIPDEFRDHLRLRTSLTCLVCYEKVTHHRADHALRQFGIPVDQWKPLLADLDFPPDLESVKRSKRSGKKEDDWAILNQNFVDFWSRRWENCIPLYQEVPLSVVEEGHTDIGVEVPIVDDELEWENFCKDFSELVVSQGPKFGLFLKKIWKEDNVCLSKRHFIEATSSCLNLSSLASNEFSEICTSDGKHDNTEHTICYSAKYAEMVDAHQKQLEEIRYYYEEKHKQIQFECDEKVKQIQSESEQEYSRLEHCMKSLQVATSSNQKVLVKTLEENRILYNQVQDLKGAIRVYCRVRPFLLGQPSGHSTVDHIDENGKIVIVNPLKQGKYARRVFSFNKVFDPNMTQEQIYKDTQPLVRSILDGFNVCIFAYGQTGSGKTYTMSGPDMMTEETWGVNYRTLHDLFHISKERADVIQYEIGVQIVEIYNEKVRDLLARDGCNRQLDIRHNSQSSGLNVPDACLVPVTCTQDVLDLMRIGLKNRVVGATALNERSSRSHSVLTVHVRGKELVSNSILNGCLNLVDLAGSERVDKSEAVGERLKEAQHINKSLSALGDVISALAQKRKHIPYRNSKLTQVLQNSLGGHAKTLMLVHINPEVNAFEETISTLKFAERVASVELGAAQCTKRNW